ncbi:hypothetical protein VCHC51A1_3078, partial [Vibrio cholerae HC-51A1]
MAGERI